MTRGEKLRQARERAGLDAWELARKLYISGKAIMDMESGKLEMGDPMRGWLEKVLELKAGELRGDDEDAGHDAGGDADGGSDGGDRPHGGGSAAAQAH